MASNSQLVGFTRFLKNIARIGEKALIKAIEFRKPEMIDENIAQMERGEDPFGEPFDEYSEASVNIYGKEEGPITWKDTGDFYESVDIEKTKGNEFTFKSDDPKFEKFIEPRAEPLGLQEDVIENEIIDLIADDVLDYLTEELDKRTGK